VRTALGVGAYFAANVFAILILGDHDAWFVSTVVIHVALALAGRRPHVLLLPLVFIAALAIFDKFVLRSNGTGDCHDWCGDLALWGGFLVFWLPLALFATTGTLLVIWFARLLHNEIVR
jgi:hypothetical protein